MPLRASSSSEGIKGSPEWKHLPGGYKCQVCKNSIKSYDKDIEYVKTKRGTHIFIHTNCAYKGG